MHIMTHTVSNTSPKFGCLSVLTSTIPPGAVLWCCLMLLHTCRSTSSFNVSNLFFLVIADPPSLIMQWQGIGVAVGGAADVECCIFGICCIFGRSRALATWVLQGRRKDPASSFVANARNSAEDDSDHWMVTPPTYTTLVVGDPSTSWEHLHHGAPE